MSTWLAMIADENGALATQLVEASDLARASDATRAMVPAGGVFVSVALIEDAPVALTTGIQKLVDLGLSVEEAAAVAGVPADPDPQPAP